MTRDDGGPIYPRPAQLVQSPFSHAPHMDSGHAGMSLRDYFAGQALAGIAANPVSSCYPGGEIQSQAEARLAYRLADAMLAERIQRSTPDDMA